MNFEYNILNMIMRVELLGNSIYKINNLNTIYYFVKLNNMR